MNSSNKNTRYNRQTILKELGEIGQEKLSKAKVLVIGAGGLGCPALQYLAAAGVGTIGIVDFDVVDLSNLQRQILFTVDDIGKSKAETAGIRLKEMNPEIELSIINYQLSNKNALDIISNFEIVIDGSDNFETRYLVNDACVLLNKPLVYGAVLRFEGQVAVFNLEDKITKLKINYRDLFPEAPENSISCNEIGVLGIVPGIIGIMQATEAIKIITGIGEPLCNKLLTYNALNNSFYDFEISKATSLKINYPKNKEEYLAFDYNLDCKTNSVRTEISIEDFEQFKLEREITIIDVREKGELPLVTEFEHINIPLGDLKTTLDELEMKNTILIFCNTGQRSSSAVSFIKKRFPSAEIFSLSGGIVTWKKNIEMQQQ